MDSIKKYIKQAREWVKPFARRYWIGTLAILLFTTVFFWPLITRIGTYSEGGDAMFNAWTLARNHYCMLGQGCPNYTDGNIYFPNKDSMLFSETQLSTSFVSLPLHFIDQNPIFAYNIVTMVSFFLSAWFMYLLAKRLSGGNEPLSILAGLLFAFAPHRMAGIAHLQNLSIFCLPLAVLFILKYFEKPKRWYLGGLFLTFLYLFYASWYQVFFALIGVGVLLAGHIVVKPIQWRKILPIGAVILLAGVMALPLATQYMRFSKEHKAGFTIGEQVYYSASVADYFLPNTGTFLGKEFYKREPNVKINSYNPDSSSGHGYTLYAVAVAVLVAAFCLRKKGKEFLANYRLVVVFVLVGVVGLIVSLGPLLKLGGGYSLAQFEEYKLVVPLPYLAVDVLLPQLSFIRAIGRASVLVLFALCALLALFAFYIRESKIARRKKQAILGVVVVLAVLELIPAHRFLLTDKPYNYSLKVPAVYAYIKGHQDIDNIIVLRADKDYPNAPMPIARTEDVLWAGYHNRNIFNGYSGYEPPTYMRDYKDFVDLKADDLLKMRKLGLRYVLIDKQLSSSNPALAQNAKELLPQRTFEDDRYALYKL